MLASSYNATWNDPPECMMPPSSQPLVITPKELRCTSLALSLTLLHAAAVIKQLRGALCVGYTLKPARQRDLIAQGFLPFNPGSEGIFCVPVDPEVAKYPHALSCLDVLLLKPTDFLERCPGSGTVPPFKPVLHDLEQATRRYNKKARIIGSLNSLDLVMDRGKMAEAIDEACATVRSRGLNARSAAWKVVEKLDESTLNKAANEAGVNIPCFVKPVLACGNVEAHAMAVVLHPEGLRYLRVPSPALVQEFINHGGMLWKVYVAGKDIFVIKRRSLPDLPPYESMFLSSTVKKGDHPSQIDGETSAEHRSLPPFCMEVDADGRGDFPMQWPWMNNREYVINGLDGSRNGSNGTVNGSEGCYLESSGEGGTQMPGFEVEDMHNFIGVSKGSTGNATQGSGVDNCDMEEKIKLFRSLANALEQKMNLILFGFDVLFDRTDEAAVVVDVNFFPSYKNIRNAPDSVRSALLQSRDVIL